MVHAKSLITKMPHDAPERLAAEGCILYEEKKYEEAKFLKSINMTCYQCDIDYNIALYYFNMKQLAT